MYADQVIAAVIPAKNEATQIGQVIDTMPPMVDRIIIIDDGSTDDMSDVVRQHAESDSRVRLIRHETSRGVGGAIAAGYLAALEEDADIAVVMAGDGQMDPDDLELVVSPVAHNKADYSKGNRFLYLGGRQRIPPVRKFGNFVLSMLTKVASGYWHVSDTQCGYTAISAYALRRIDVENIYPSYGCPNDICIKLNIADMRLVEVPVNPLYGVGEESKMRIVRVVLPILRLLSVKFGQRLFEKYFIRSGHPLLFAYLFAGVGFIACLLLSLYLIVQFAITGVIMKAALIAFATSLIVTIHLVLTAFGMDAEANRHVCIHLSPRELDELCGDDRAATPASDRHARV